MCIVLVNVLRTYIGPSKRIFNCVVLMFVLAACVFSITRLGKFIRRAGSDGLVFKF